MARKLKLVLNEETIEMALVKVDRDKLYGHRETIVVDSSERPLAKGYLDEWGSVVIDQTGIGYLDDAGEWRSRNELVPVDEADNELEILPSSFDAPVVLGERVGLDTFLDYEIVSVYQLEGFEAAAFAEKLAAHEGLFTFSFNYRAGHNPKTAFLNPVDENLFMMVGTPTDLDYLDKPRITELDARDEDDEDEDDLDFGMM